MGKRGLRVLAMTVALAGAAWLAPFAEARTSATPLRLALQQPTVSAPDQVGGDGFEPVSSLPAPQETLPAAPMVMAAYGFVWVMVLGYVWSVWRRLGAVERELMGVARRVDDLQRK
jgi:CcmD family protein